MEALESYLNKLSPRENVYEAVVDQYHIESALYPGSHADISPSLYIPHVTYVDQFKGTFQFFKDITLIQNYVRSKKQYEIDPSITFFAQDYQKPIRVKPVQLIISMYAGFVTEATKSYLVPGGYVLCNDSHADATMTFHDNDFRLIAVISSDGLISTEGLSTYFISKRNLDLQTVRTQMKGPKYIRTADYYLFQRR